MLDKSICCITAIYLGLAVRYPDNIEFVKLSLLMRTSKDILFKGTNKYKLVDMKLNLDKFKQVRQAYSCSDLEVE